MKQRDSVRLSSKGQERLKSAILEKGISQSKVAEKASISHRTLSRFLSGKSIHKSIAILIFESLNIDDTDDLLESVLISCFTIWRCDRQLAKSEIMIG